MNELAKILREASEGRWITTKSGARVFIGGKEHAGVDSTES